MSSDLINARISEYLGLHKVSIENLKWNTPCEPEPTIVITDKNRNFCRIFTVSRGEESSMDFNYPKNYCGDLNAIHGAIATLNEDQKDYFLDTLSTVIYGNKWPEDWMNKEWEKLINATAAQRAEAFLRVIGKWEE